MRRYLLFLVCVLLHFYSFAKLDVTKYRFFEDHIESGQYEDAIQIGERLFRKALKRDTLGVPIVAALLSKTTYFWYQFRVSERYFEKALSVYNRYPFTNIADKAIVATYIADAAYYRNALLEGKSLIENLIKEDKNVLANAQLRIVYALLLSKLGKFEAANSELVTLEVTGIKSDTSKTVKQKNSLLFDVYLAMALNDLAYGYFARCDSNIKKMEFIKMSENYKDDHRLYQVKELKARYNFKRRNYNKAQDLYLDAYNTLDVGDEDYRKYDALKMAAICAIKAEKTSDYFKLFRRSDMLAFKKPLRSQTFRPGVFQLKMEQLIETGQYELALSKANEVNKIYAFLPKNHAYHYEFLELKARAAEYSGAINQFRELIDTLEQVALKTYSELSVQHAATKIKIAEYEWKYGGNLKNAVSVYQLYYPILQKSLYTYSIDLIPHLFGFASAFELSGKNDSALKYSENAYSIASKSWGATTPETHYALSLSILHKFNAGHYSEMMPLLTIAEDLKIQERYETHALYIKSLNMQSGIYQWLGDFTDMNKRISMAYNASLRKDENDFYGKCDMLDVMATGFLVAGNYIKAERDIKRAYELKLDQQGTNSFMLASTLMRKLELKIVKGELKEAIMVIEQLETLLPNYFTTKDIPWAQLLFLKSKYFAAIADYKKAKEFLSQAITTYGSIYGTNHIRLYPLYAELAKILVFEGATKYKEANEMYEKAKTIITKSLGENTPSYAFLLVQQANLMVLINEFDPALKNLNQAETFWKKQLGDDNTYIAEIMLVKGNLYYKQKKYPDADRSYKRSADLYTNLFNKNYPGALSAKVGVAKVAYMQKDFYQAEEVMGGVLDTRLAFADANFSIMSFAQKNSFWAGFKEEFEFYYALSYKVIKGTIKPKQTAKVYNYALQTKGLLMNSDAKIRRVVFQSGDSTLIANYNDWLYQKEYYALVSTYSQAQLAEESIVLNKLEEAIIDLEKRINAKTNIDIGNKETVDWTLVKQNLPPNAAAIEMLRFRVFNHVFTDTVVYGAYIINEKAKDKPDVVFLEDGKKMERSYLNYFRNAAINKLDDDNSYSVFWEPIKKKIPDGHTVFLASEGVYTQLNPEMLYNSTTKKYALESNTFVFVTNTRDVIVDVAAKQTSSATDGNQKYYLFGNPAFHQNLGPNQKPMVPALAGAEREVNEIHATLSQRNKSSVQLLGAAITEDTIKSLQSPTVLHISTHGFFMEGQVGKNEITNNPMLNSGLMLTGSGDILAANDAYINQRPGILTASEVMDLNFTNTNLVVLSACETGRGQVEVGEGVFGLQRAFLVAGAKIVVLSLFKVDDDATNLLMVTFYDKFLRNGGDYRKAFREAKQELRNKPQFSAPIYWGPFIMIEGKRTKKALTN